MAPTTLPGMKTTSSPNGRDVETQGFPIRMAFETQARGLGFSMVELLSTCLTNWGMTPVESLKFVEQYMVPAFPLGDHKVSAGVVLIKV